MDSGDKNENKDEQSETAPWQGDLQKQNDLSADQSFLYYLWNFWLIPNSLFFFPFLP